MTYAYRPLPPSDMVTKVTKAFFGRFRRFFVGHGSGGPKRPFVTFVTFVTVSLGVGGAGTVRAVVALVDALNPSSRGLFSVAPPPVSRFSLAPFHAGLREREFGLLRGSHRGVK